MSDNDQTPLSEIDERDVDKNAKYYSYDELDEWLKLFESDDDE